MMDSSPLEMAQGPDHRAVCVRERVVYFRSMKEDVWLILKKAPKLPEEFS